MIRPLAVVAGLLARGSGTDAWAAIGVLAVVVEMSTVLGRRVVRVDRLLGALMHPWPGKALLLVGWWWLGWHFFAR